MISVFMPQHVHYAPQFAEFTKLTEPCHAKKALSEAVT